MITLWSSSENVQGSLLYLHVYSLPLPFPLPSHHPSFGILGPSFPVVRAVLEYLNKNTHGSPITGKDRWEKWSLEPAPLVLHASLHTTLCVTFCILLSLFTLLSSSREPGELYLQMCSTVPQTLGSKNALLLSLNCSAVSNALVPWFLLSHSITNTFAIGLLKLSHSVSSTPAVSYFLIRLHCLWRLLPHRRRRV